jgi:hypothetical protein
MSNASQLIASQYRNSEINRRIWADVYYTFKEFGALGDGENDDTLAIKNCLAAAKQSGASVMMTPGHYIINEMLDVECSLIGASMKDVILDFSGNPDSSCLFFNFSKLIAEKFTIRCNSSVTTQVAMNVYYCTDASSFREIVIEDNAPNGIYVSRLFYANFNNIRMRSVLPTGYGIQIYNHAEGGVNAVKFANIYIQGGLNSVLFNGTGSYSSEGTVFDTCTFESSFKTAVKNNSQNLFNIKFENCYFENSYANTTDASVPVLLDSVITANKPIQFNNTTLRASNANSRYITTGLCLINVLYNINFMNMNTDGAKNIIVQAFNVGGIAKDYHNSYTGSTIVEKIGVNEARYLFKKAIGTKAVPINTPTSLFTVKCPASNGLTVMNVRLIIPSSVNTYAATVAEYLVFCNARGSAQESKFILKHSIESNASQLATNFTFSVSASAYNATTNTHDFTVSVTATHANLVGTYLIEVEGINSTTTENGERKILFL